MTSKELREKLLFLSDKKQSDFQNKLGINTMPDLGIKIPMVRNIAKEIFQEDYKNYLKNPNNLYLEEVFIEGMIIGYIKDFNEILPYIDRFIPKITNWGICDVFCGGLKITKKHLKEMWDYLDKHLSSDNEFTLRFCLVMLLSYYLNEEYINEVLKITDKIKSDYYYVKMAQAWLISIAYIKYPEITLAYLKKSQLDNWTFNKGIQKIRESLRVDKTTKDILNKLKR